MVGSYIEQERRIIMISVTKIIHFEAAHYLPGYNGPCANMHGHTYTLEVEVAGHPDESGMVCDFKKIKSIVQEEIISICDHKLLNDSLPFFNPTAENMVQLFADKLRLSGLNVIRIRLWETRDSYAEWRK